MRLNQPIKVRTKEPEALKYEVQEAPSFVRTALVSRSAAIRVYVNEPFKAPECPLHGTNYVTTWDAYCNNCAQARMTRAWVSSSHCREETVRNLFFYAPPSFRTEGVVVIPNSRHFSTPNAVVGILNLLYSGQQKPKLHYKGIWISPQTINSHCPFFHLLLGLTRAVDINFQPYLRPAPAKEIQRILREGDMYAARQVYLAIRSNLGAIFQIDLSVLDEILEHRVRVVTTNEDVRVNRANGPRAYWGEYQQLQQEHMRRNGPTQETQG